MQQHSPGGSSAHLRPPGSPRSSIAKSMKSSLTAASGSPTRSSSKKSEKSLLLSQQINHTTGVANNITSTTATTHTSSSHSHSGSGIKAIFFLPIGVFMFVIWNMVQVQQNHLILHSSITLFYTISTIQEQHTSSLYNNTLST